MTVQAAVRMWSRHDASITADGGRKYKATIKEAYQVVCDATDTLRDVSNGTGFPKLNDLYPGSVQIRVTSVSPRQVSPIFWIVEITYEGNFGPQGITESPLNEPPIIKWGKIESDEPIDEDRDGKPIVTVNNEPIEGVTKKISDLTVQIQRNFAAINLPATYKYLNSVNSDNFLGFSPGVVRLTEFGAGEVFAESIGGYWQVNAGFQVRWPYRTTAQKAWYARVRHEGFLEKNTEGKIVPAMDDDNLQQVTKPVLLKLDGTRERNRDNAVWLEFPLYDPLPYSLLGLL